MLILDFVLSWTLTAHRGPKVSGHSTAAIYDHIFSFGGLTGSAGSETTNELWKYNGVTWTHIKSAQTPPRRMYSSLSYIESENALYLVGGWDPEKKGSGGNFKDDVWKFNCSSFIWTQLESLPICTSRHSACSILGKVVIQTYQATFFLEDDVIKEQPTTGDSPIGISLSACAPLDNNKMLIFGGSTKNQNMTNMIFILNCDTWKWTKINPGKNTPSCRAGCSMTRLSDNIFIVSGGAGISSDGYSGGKGLLAHNDTYLLKVEGNTATWKIVDTSLEPRVGANINKLGDSIFLSGGWNPITKRTYCETRKLRWRALLENFE